MGISIALKNNPIIKQNQSYLFQIHVYNETNGQPLNNVSIDCALHIYSKNGNHEFINNDLNFSEAYDFYQNVSAGNFSNSRNYGFIIACRVNDGGVGGGYCIGEFIVTPDGNEYSPYKLTGYIFLIFISIITIMGVSYSRKLIDKEKLHNKIKYLYENKNTIKLHLYSLFYYLIESTFITYYLSGLFILIILNMIVSYYDLSELIQTLQIILGLYVMSSILIALIVFGKVQELAISIKEEFENLDLGVKN